MKQKNIYTEIWGETTQQEKREQEKRNKEIDHFNRMALKKSNSNLSELNGDLINKDGVY